MSPGEAPLPARFYPAGGDAHGHPARLAWDDGMLLVQPEDSSGLLRVPADQLRVEARGFNHSQWAIAWAGDAGATHTHLLLVDDARIAPLRTAAPALFAAGDTTRRHSHRRFRVGIVLLAAIPLAFVGALLLSVEPLAERLVDHIPPGVEQQIGEAVLAHTRAAGPMITAGPAFEALQAIGKRLARPGEVLHFHLAARPEINAFAAPGGIVVVHSALLASAGSAEEVAGVLAHEIAHVELRHSLRQIVKSAGLRIILTGLSGDYAPLGGWAAQLGELKFSRDAERAADARGLERLKEARIDPLGMLRFFETLAANTPSGPALLSTHPATAERIDSLKAAIAAAPGAPAQSIGIDWEPVKKALKPPPGPQRE